MALTRIGPNQSINLASNVTGTLPTANGGTGATSFTKGKVLQVVSTSAANDLGTTSTSYVDIHLSLNITPSATSSKIFLVYTGNNETNGTGGNKLSLQMLRDSTQIADATGVGALGSNYGNVTSNALSVLDTPNTTSQITYKMQGKSDDGTIMVFNVNNDLGTITAYEIEG